MDVRGTKPGYSRAQPATEVALAPPPWSPWLRLANFWRSPAAARGGVPLRRIRDWQLVLRIEGESWLWWGPAGGSVPMPVGALVLIPPGIEHAYGDEPGLQVGLHADLHADPTLCADVALDMLEPLPGKVTRRDLTVMPELLVRLGDDPPIAMPLVTRVARVAPWRERFLPLVEQWRLRTHSGALARLRSAALIAEAFHAFFALHAPGAITTGRTSRDRVAALLSALEFDRQRTSVATLARRAGLGESAFRDAVLDLTGETPRRWLERRRLERALHLLHGTDRGVAEVAAACGYDDPFHFSRVCRRLTGLSPRQLRAQARSGS